MDRGLHIRFHKSWIATVGTTQSERLIRVGRRQASKISFNNGLNRAEDVLMGDTAAIQGYIHGTEQARPSHDRSVNIRTG
jgi:hypothetical protein